MFCSIPCTLLCRSPHQVWYHLVSQHFTTRVSATRSVIPLQARPSPPSFVEPHSLNRSQIVVLLHSPCNHRSPSLCFIQPLSPSAEPVILLQYCVDLVQPIVISEQELRTNGGSSSQDHNPSHVSSPQDRRNPRIHPSSIYTS